jgi:hypothetical protein
VTTHGTGYAWKHPQAALAAASPTNWKFRHLLAGATLTPYQQIPDFDYDLGPVLNQGSSPACTRFSVTGIRNYQEKQDGAPDFPFDSAEALLSYQRLKSGYGAWPGDGIPYAAGDIPLNVWRYEQLVGSQDAAGEFHTIANYYQDDAYSGQTEQQWLDEFFNVMLLAGPVSVSSGWPNNWMPDPAPSLGVMPTPGGASAGHQWAAKGKKTLTAAQMAQIGYPSLSGIMVRNRQGWGWPGWGIVDSFGRGGEFLIPVEWFAYTTQLGLHECWKSVDKPGEWPAPPAPPEPAMTVKLIGSPQLVDLAVGTQCYQRADGTTPLVTIKSGGTGVFSPGAFSTTQLVVRISTGGIVQEAIVNATDAKNARPLYAAQVVK